MNYIVYGLGKKKYSARYAPLSIVEITSPHDAISTHKMLVAKEIHLLYAPERIPMDMRRQTIALFIAEVLYRTLRLPLEDTTLFDYIASTSKALDCIDSPENLHLSFLIGLAERLGFAIDEEKHTKLLHIPHTRTERQQQLQALCAYYERHIDDWQTPRSLEVLMEVFETVHSS